MTLAADAGPIEGAWNIHREGSYDCGKEAFPLYLPQKRSRKVFMTNDAVGLLQQAARQVRDLEAEAQKVLQENNDVEAYTKCLTEKCLLLMDLPDAVAGAAFSDTEQEKIIKKTLAGMAKRAGQALDLDSRFYMWNLLYPDDYQPGQLNELELFIKELEAE